MDSAQNAGQRFDHGRIDEGDMRRNLQHILAHDAPGDADVFGICAVIEKQILAQIAAFLAAKETDAAGRRVRGHYARAHSPILGSFRAHLLDHSGEFMAENRGRSDHSRMITALPNLEIGAASERHFNPHQHFVRRQGGNIDLFDFQVLAAIEHRGGHMPAGLCFRQRLGQSFHCFRFVSKNFKERSELSRSCSAAPRDLWRSRTPPGKTGA